ncbi:39S ribosomal protein L4, mitochondrial isoform X1 [Theropithecus gelada]|uniref:39S ribosomal protein L4, mitochondrial isoform X1 n=1 Tax=Theropithecus gelada TaxID=9565 RepID=UPI000DC1AA86|nr:39S ribosomal protein L4, mitochondrial isoform X1 [Theropithecus gelada]XP_025224183.1 39S ribosomal protein L4, mitochondrial isoform X1 [Theropithecus gelada]
MLQLVRAGARAWLRPTGCRGLSSLAEEAARPTENPEQVAVASEGLPEPVLRKVELPVPAHRRPVQAWVESLRGFEQERVGLADLHPDVFATAPRLDILHQVAMWQKNFKRISYAKTKTRAEVRGGGRKPWPQKGTGRARHGSIRSPLWRGGGVAHGPRGPTSYYYMLPMKVRALGLKVALSIKLAQDDLHIMDSLELPTGDPQYLTELARYRRWGDSVLLVDLTYEEMPQSIVEATSRLKTFNLIPAVGELRPRPPACARAVSTVRITAVQIQRLVTEWPWAVSTRPDPTLSLPKAIIFPKEVLGWGWWLMLVIPVLWEAKIVWPI